MTSRYQVLSERRGKHAIRDMDTNTDLKIFRNQLEANRYALTLNRSNPVKPS